MGSLLAAFALSALVSSYLLLSHPLSINPGPAIPSPQVLLYLLLMEERYGRPLDWGMLWYTHQPGEAAMRGMPLGWTLQLGLHILYHLWALSQRRRMPCRYPADPQLVMKRPMELACLMAVRNRLAAAIAHLELPPLSGG